MKKISFFALAFVSTLVFADSSGSNSGGSQSNRGNKSWGWLVDVGNLTFGNVNAFGVGGGVNLFVSGNSVISAELGSGTNYDFLSSFVGDTVNASTNWQGLYYKGFVSNSFYLKTGIEATQIHYRVTHYPLIVSSYSQSAYINLYSAVLAIGNQWQRSSFTIGCDWIALDVPIANSGYSETVSGTPSGTPWDLKSDLTKTGGTFGRFYLGMNF